MKKHVLRLFVSIISFCLASVGFLPALAENADVNGSYRYYDYVRHRELASRAALSNTRNLFRMILPMKRCSAPSTGRFRKRPIFRSISSCFQPSRKAAPASG